MAIVIDGTGSITGLSAGGLPDGSITAADLAAGAARSNFGAGAVLQVVQATTTSNFSSNNTLVTVLEANITPSSASNKVLMMYTCAFADNSGNSEDGSIYLKRGGSGGTNFSFQGGRFQYFWSGSRVQIPTSGVYLDSPSSTSSTTYGVYINSGGGSPFLMYGCILVLMEVAG